MPLCIYLGSSIFSSLSAMLVTRHGEILHFIFNTSIKRHNKPRRFNVLFISQIKPSFSFQFPPKRQAFLCQGMVASAQDTFGLDERQRRRFPFVGMPGIFIHTIKSEYQFRFCFQSEKISPIYEIKSANYEKLESFIISFDIREKNYFGNEMKQICFPRFACLFNFYRILSDIPKGIMLSNQISYD